MVSSFKKLETHNFVVISMGEGKSDSIIGVQASFHAEYSGYTFETADLG